MKWGKRNSDKKESCKPGWLILLLAVYGLIACGFMPNPAWSKGAAFNPGGPALHPANPGGPGPAFNPGGTANPSNPGGPGQAFNPGGTANPGFNPGGPSPAPANPGGPGPAFNPGGSNPAGSQ